MLKFPSLVRTFDAQGYSGNANLGNEAAGKLFTGSGASRLVKANFSLSAPPVDSSAYSSAASYAASFNALNGVTLSDYPTWELIETWRVDRYNFDSALDEYFPYDPATNPHGPDILPYAASSGDSLTGGGWTVGLSESYSGVLAGLETWLTGHFTGTHAPTYALLYGVYSNPSLRSTLSFTAPMSLPWGLYFVTCTKTYRVLLGYPPGGRPVYAEITFTGAGNFLQRLTAPVTSSVVAASRRGAAAAPSITVSGTHPHFSMSYAAGSAYYGERMDLLVSVSDDAEPETYLGPNSWVAAVTNPGPEARGPIDFSGVDGSAVSVPLDYSDAATFLAPPGIAAYEATNGPLYPRYEAAAGCLPPNADEYFAFYGTRQIYPLGVGSPYVYEIGIPGRPGSYTYYWITQSNYPETTQVYDDSGFIQGMADPSFNPNFVYPPFNASDTASDTTDYGFLPATVIRIDIIVTGTVPADPTITYNSLCSLGYPADNFQRVIADINGLQFYRSISGTPFRHGMPASLWDDEAIPITVVPQGPPAPTVPRDRSPSLFFDPRRILYCVFERKGATSSDVYLTRTTDDGRTWEAAVLAITGGTRPAAASDESGRVVMGALITAGSGGSATYTITAEYRGPGDPSFSAPFTLKDHAGTALSVQNDSFSFAFVKMSTRALLLTVIIAGETAPSEWVCYDLSATGASFARIT